MVEKHKIIKKLSKEYNRSGKKGKGVILRMVVRGHLSRILCKCINHYNSYFSILHTITPPPKMP